MAMDPRLQCLPGVDCVLDVSEMKVDVTGCASAATSLRPETTVFGRWRGCREWPSRLRRRSRDGHSLHPRHLPKTVVSGRSEVAADAQPVTSTFISETSS